MRRGASQGSAADAAEAGAEPLPVAGGFMQRQIGHLLRRAYMRARRNSAEALSALAALSPVQASVLAALAAGRLNQAELGRRIGMEPANTHTLVRRLVLAGLVEISADPGNRRLSLVALSARGTELAGQLEPVLADAAARTLAPLDQAERRQLLDLLARLAFAEDDADSASPDPGDRALAIAV